MNFVYFLRADETGRIKIGTTSNLKARLSAIRTSSSERVGLACAIPGTEALEQLLHERFAETRVRGEWFAPSPELVAFIDGARLMHGQIAQCLDGMPEHPPPDGWLLSTANPGQWSSDL